VSAILRDSRLAGMSVSPWLRDISAFYYNNFDREGPKGADLYILL
jgi:hypothetical protein